MPDEGDHGGSSPSDDDALMRAIARAPSRPVGAGDTDVDPVRVAHFKIGGRLGSGGMGVVFRAQDESLRREVALKLLPAVSAGDPERRQRFLREARVAASLVHPNVAVVYQVGEDGGRVYIAMELVDGTTLRRPLERGAMAVEVVRDFALQVAQGLAAAHAKGIVHRDLKPENVMVTGSGTVKLLDFGLAKSGWVSDGDSALANADTEAQITREGDVLGSSAYMSPEQALGLTVDARSDVFSFGIVLYEMLCGRRPFLGRTLGEIRAAIAREPPLPLNASVDAGLARIVTKCLAKKAEERYADAGVVVLELAALSPISEGARRVGASEPPTRERPGRPLGTWAIAGAVAAVIVGSVFATRSRGAPPAPGAPSSVQVAAGAADASSEGAIDDGANPSTNPEAQRLYEKALLAEVNDSCEAAVSLLERAVAADPSFAAAHLRLFGIGQDGALPHLQRAVALESTLSTRDKTLLSVVEPSFAGGNPAAAIATAEKYLERHPRDIWMWNALIDLHWDDAAVLPTMNRAIASNPASVVLQGWKAAYLLHFGRDARAARETADQCLAKVPRAPECLLAQVQIESKAGECRDFEADARRWLFLAPESLKAHEYLAEALASNNASPEAVGEALRPASGNSDQRDRSRPFLVPYYDGDFAETERIAKAQLQNAATSSEIDAHFTPAWQLISAYLESGDLANASRAAQDFVTHAPAWGAGGQSSGDYEGLMLNVIEAAGQVPHAEAAARRAAVYREATSRGKTSIDAWWSAYSSPRTIVEAREALEAFDRLGLRMSDYAPPHWAAKSIAEAFAVADEGEQGRPLLEEMAHECLLLTQVKRILLAELALGRLDQAKGDTASACAHYAKVLARWGHAKPRSVTADEARARSRALGCSPP